MARAVRPFLKMLVWAAGAWTLLGNGLAWAGASQGMIKVLLLSGRNNHAWEQTTPALVKTFVESGRFEVDVTDSPSTWTSPSLDKYDVIVSNWTHFPSQDRTWGPQAEAAFLDFVRQGKGFALFHAASVCFASWPEFQQVIGATWGAGTGHGPVHRFTVDTTDLDHPITAGLGSFYTTDELWHRMQTQPSAQVLCEAYSSPEQGGSGQREPVAFCTRFGQGRCFNLVLGHDVQAIRPIGWIMLMLRGTQWAATGTATIEAPFDLTRELQSAADNQQGKDRAVEALRPYLGNPDPNIAGPAIGAMGRIGGTDALKALQDCTLGVPASLRAVLADAKLQCAEGLPAKDREIVYQELIAAHEPAPVRRAAFIAWIECQDLRGDASNALLAAIKGDDSTLQSAAIHSVRQVRNSTTRQSVAGQLATVPVSLQPLLVQALDDTSDRQVLPGIIQLLSSPSPEVRISAINAIGRQGDESHVALLAGHLKTTAPGEQKAAQEGLARLPGDRTDEILVRELKSSKDPQVRTSIIQILVERQAAQAVPLLLTLTEEADREVRHRAILAIGSLADTGAYGALINVLNGQGSEDEWAAVESAMAAIGVRSPDPNEVLEQIAAGLSVSKNPQAKASLLRVAGRIGGPRALGLVRGSISDPSVREASIRVLCAWPDSEALADLLILARETTNPAHRILALRGFAGLCRKADGRPAESMTRMIGEAIPLAERPDEKKALLSVLPQFPCMATLSLAMSQIGDPALANEAILAALGTAEGMKGQPPQAIRSALQEISTRTMSAQVAERVKALTIQLDRPVNLALGAIASSPDRWEKDGAAGGDPAGIDGNPATYWDEEDGKDIYRYRVTFPKPTAVSSLRLTGYEHHHYAPKEFDVLCDDSIVKTIREAVYTDNALVVTFPATTCTSIELKIVGRYGPSPAIRELELYHDAPGR